MNTGNENEPVPPFIEDRPTRPVVAMNWFVTGLGWSSLTLALIGGAKLVWDYLVVDNSPDLGSLWAQSVALTLVFLTGWVISLFTIRKLHNTAFPLVVRAYSFFVSMGLVVIYGRAILKYYTENTLTFGKYAFVLFAGL